MKKPIKKLKKAAMKKRLKVSNLIKRIMVMLVFIVLIFIFEAKSDHGLDRVINDIFLLDFKGDFEKNVFGKIVFKTRFHGRLSYVSLMTGEERQEDDKWVSLSEIVDVSTWKEVESHNIHTRKFEDLYHTYELYFLYKELYFLCIKKENKAKVNNPLK